MSDPLADPQAGGARIWHHTQPGPVIWSGSMRWCFAVNHAEILRRSCRSGGAGAQRRRAGRREKRARPGRVARGTGLLEFIEGVA